MNLSNYLSAVGGSITRGRRRCLVLAGVCVVLFGQLASADLVNVLTIPGESRDLWPGTAPHDNRLGFGSDLVFDPKTSSFFGLADRGPEGSPYFVSRIQQFRLDLDQATGAIGNFQLMDTIPLKTADGAMAYDGRVPSMLNGNPQTLGLSLDPEGLAIGPNGSFYVADEFGPSLYEFAPVDIGGQLEARFVRALTVPDNLVPRDATGAIHYEASRTTDPAQASGRQSARGYEGLAITPDGKSLLAILQDPLYDEGEKKDGRRSRNLRIVRFDVATGASNGQFIYPLEDIVDINRRISPDTAFTTTNQGRNVGVSSITAVNDHQFLVLERDGRGLDVENAALADPVLNAVGTKRVYEIDLSQATDVSQVHLAGTNYLPSGAKPVGKKLLFDIQSELQYTGVTIPSKMEGLALGPRLADGQFSIIISTDNDFSTLELEDPMGGPPAFFDVFTDGTTAPVGGDSLGRTLLPLHVMAFRSPSLMAANGDFNQDGQVNVIDIDRLSSEIAGRQNPDTFDLTTDRRVDGQDLRYFARYLSGSWLGDANLDGLFNSGDLVQVSQTGGYEQPVRALWSQGDWLGDGLFTSADLLVAFQDGGYEAGPRRAVGVVPEPSAWLQLIMCSLGFCSWRGNNLRNRRIGQSTENDSAAS